MDPSLKEINKKNTFEKTCFGTNKHVVEHGRRHDWSGHTSKIPNCGDPCAPGACGPPCMCVSDNGNICTQIPVTSDSANDYKELICF